MLIGRKSSPENFWEEKKFEHGFKSAMWSLKIHAFCVPLPSFFFFLFFLFHIIAIMIDSIRNLFKNKKSSKLTGKNLIIELMMPLIED